MLTSFSKDSQAVLINKQWECYSAFKKKKKNEIMPFAATWMDLETVILSEKVRQRQISCDIAYMWNLRKKEYK